MVTPPAQVGMAAFGEGRWPVWGVHSVFLQLAAYGFVIRCAIK